MDDCRDSPRLDMLIVTGIFPPDIGGPATYVPAMASELVKRGHRVVVVTLSEAVHDHSDEYPFRVVRLRRGLFKPIRIALSVAAIIRNGRDVDVLLVNGLYLEACIANLALRKPQVQKWVADWAWDRATNKRWVRSSLETFQRSWSGVRAELFKRLRNYCVSRADAVIVPSRYLGHMVAGWGVSHEKTITIYNAVEIPSVSPSLIPLSTEIKLVTVARLITVKGVDQVIRAMVDCGTAGLLVIGDGPERNRLENLVQALGLGDRVCFAGQRDRTDTLTLMAACDLFVLNSTHEGFPHVVLEAMSLGLPVVATAVGGTPELVHDGVNGVLYSAKSDGDLSEILSRLIASPNERARLAQAGRRSVEQFRRSTMIDRTEAVLWEACERRSAVVIRDCSGTQIHE